MMSIDKKTNETLAWIREELQKSFDANKQLTPEERQIQQQDYIHAIEETHRKEMAEYLKNFVAINSIDIHLDQEQTKKLICAGLLSYQEHLENKRSDSIKEAHKVVDNILQHVKK